MHSLGAIPVFVAVCLCAPVAAQHAAQKTPPPPPPQQAQKPVRNQASVTASAGKAVSKVAPPETIQAGTPVGLDRLIKLTPEQRKRALDNLPPARRTKIQQQLAEYQKTKPEERAKVLDHYNRMQALPPQKRLQVRASLQQFAGLPQPRKALVRRQLTMMKGLSETDRRTLMNSEEFRNKFTASEQQMIEDMALITPEEL